MGVFSLKFELTEFLLNYGGHIGYAARPSERNRGLATQTLLLNGFGFIYNGDIIFSLTYRKIGIYLIPYLTFLISQGFQSLKL